MAITDADRYQTDVYLEQGGGALRTKSGGDVDMSGGKRMVGGSQSVTGTVTVDLSGTLTGIDYAWATLGTSPGTGAGAPFLTTVAVSGTDLVVKVWQDDATAATAASLVYYGAVGDPA